MKPESISGWVRQARYRANKIGVHNDLKLSDVLSMVEENKLCDYCGKVGFETFDHAFPFKDGAANVLANLTVVCKACKGRKKNNDLIWAFNSGIIDGDIYLKLLQKLLNRRGGDLIKSHVRTLTGRDHEQS